MAPANRIQAMIPDGAEPLANRFGTAPGIAAEVNGAVFDVYTDGGGATLYVDSDVDQTGIVPRGTSALGAVTLNINQPIANDLSTADITTSITNIRATPGHRRI